MLLSKTQARWKTVADSAESVAETIVKAAREDCAPAPPVWQGRAAGGIRPALCSSGLARQDSAVAIRAGVIGACTGA
jgi:hypothetical protein